MRLIKILLTLATAGVLCACLQSETAQAETAPQETAQAETMLSPAFTAASPALRPALPAARTVETLASEISTESEAGRAASVWRGRWTISLAPLVAAQALDAASSYGLRELNPLLQSPNGGFGAKAVSIKFGAIAGLVGAEYLVVRKYPRSAKLFAIVNWTTAGATAGLAVHNYRLPGR